MDRLLMTKVSSCDRQLLYNHGSNVNECVVNEGRMMKESYFFKLVDDVRVQL